MPCYDSRDEPDFVRREAKKEFQQDLDILTRLLCEAMGYLDTRNIGDGSDELRSWWKEHKKLDRERRKRQ